MVHIYLLKLVLGKKFHLPIVVLYVSKVNNYMFKSSSVSILVGLLVQSHDLSLFSGHVLVKVLIHSY